MIRLFLEEPKGFYLYIGITSLYLKDTTGKPKMQDGILAKRRTDSLCRIQKSASKKQKTLTSLRQIW